MLNNIVLEKIFMHPEMHKIPIGCQSTAVNVFQDVLEEIKEIMPYAPISDLLQSADDV